MHLMINGIDLSQRYGSVTVAGKRTVCARTLTATIPVSNLDTAFAPPNIPRHAPVFWYGDDRTLLFQGVAIYHQSRGNLMTVKAMDYGYYLAGNDGWYSFHCTPEAAVGQLAADFGLELGTVAVTGIVIRRKFGGTRGVALHQIIDTMYHLAGQKTGRRYHLCFEGSRLCVVEKPDAAGLVLDPEVNLLSSQSTVDVTNYCNTVAIRSESGRLLRTLGGGETLAGMLQRTVVQRPGQDAGDEAKQLLEDGQGEQTVTVECFGDRRLVTGTAVQVQTTGAGVAGLFWIDGDTHSWGGGQYTCSLDLNFRNLMNEVTAGSEK